MSIASSSEKAIVMDEVTSVEQLVQKMKSLVIVDVNITTCLAANVSFNSGIKQKSDRLESVLPLFHKDFVIESSSKDVHPTRYHSMFRSMFSLSMNDSLRKHGDYMSLAHEVVFAKSRLNMENSERSNMFSSLHNKRKKEMDEKMNVYIKRPRRLCSICKQVAYHDARNCPMKK